jgi:hypothetical protein
MVLRSLIALLALTDGVLHLALDMVLFRGNFGFFRLGETPQGGPPPGGGSGPPPGATPPPQLPLPLNQLFLLNFLGWVVLVVVFWLAPRWLGARAWIVDAAMILYALAVIAGWAYVGSPNPMNLGYQSKALELVLLVLLLGHLVGLLRAGPATAPAM